MIIISAPTYDIDGVVRIDNQASSSDIRGGSRRVTRTALLDGGAEIFDGGFSDADRTFRIVVGNPTKELVDAMDRLQRTYSLLTVTTEDGVFSAAPERFQVLRNTADLRLLVKKRLSA